VNVLGIDTSTAAASACLLRADGEAFAADPAPERLFEPPAHARELMPAVVETLERAGVGFEDVDAVAVGVGPGTFTGLRIGVATARALARGCGAGLHPVSSLAALAEGIDVPLRLALIDAKRGELFAALHGPHGRIGDEVVMRPDELAARFGGDLRTALAAGDGSLRFRAILEAAGVSVAPDGSELHVVRAQQVCRLASGTGPASPEAVFPNYLREPDAVPSQ
jgi:tRNA threonylcarbamoyladenosine biosynthesis protein TsaB